MPEHVATHGVAPVTIKPDALTHATKQVYPPQVSSATVSSAITITLSPPVHLEPGWHPHSTSELGAPMHAPLIGVSTHPGTPIELIIASASIAALAKWHTDKMRAGSKLRFS